MGSESSRLARLPAPPQAVRTLALAARVLARSLTDMTLPQFRVLGLVNRAPERASHLARQAAISRPSLTGLLDGLEARGWVVRREADGDRRGVTLEVTASGRKALDAAFRAVEQRLTEVLAHVAPERRAAALDGLAALGEAIELDLAERRAAKDGGARS